MTEADGRQEGQAAGSTSADGRRRSSMNDASGAQKGRRSSYNDVSSGRKGRRSSYTNRRSSFGTKNIPPPPGSADATAIAISSRRASQDFAVSSISYRRGSQTSQERIKTLREEIAQLKKATDRELKERERDIDALRAENIGYEEKQKEIETEMHEQAERKHQQEVEELEEAERKAQSQKGRRGSGLLQRRPSFNSLGSWRSLGKLDQNDALSSSDDEEGAAAILGSSWRSSSASLAALAVVRDSLKCNAPSGNDGPPRSIEVSPRSRVSLHDSLVNLGGGVQRELMRKRPSFSSLVGRKKEDLEGIDDAAGATSTEDNQSFGKMSRRSRSCSFGSLSAMSIGISSADFEGELSQREEEDDNESVDRTITSEDKTPSVGRLGGMRKASSMRPIASPNLQRTSASSSNVTTRRHSAEDAPLSSHNTVSDIFKPTAGRRRSLEDVALSSFGSFGGLSRVRSRMDNGNDSDDRSIGAHSLGPFMFAADPRWSEETGRGQMRRRPPFGTLNLFGHGKWSKEQADRMVEESRKEKMQRERAERIQRDREDRQKWHDEQMNQLNSSLEAADKRKEELQQAKKEQEEQIALLRLQVRSAKTKQSKKAAADNSAVDPKEQQRQLDEVLERIAKGRASWTAISEKLEEADANVDSLETIARRMRRKATDVLPRKSSADTSPLISPTSMNNTGEILWSTVPDLSTIAIPVWDRVVTESDTEKNGAKARHRIIAAGSYRLAKDVNKSVGHCKIDEKGIVDVIAGFTQSLKTSKSSLEQDTSRTKLALASTQTARSIAEKMILRDIALSIITKNILSLCQSVAQSSPENGDVTSQLLSDYMSFRCNKSGLAISSKLQERLEVLRCRGDDRDRTLRSLERKKEQMEAKAKSLQQSIDEKTIDIIERKQYFMLGIQRVSKMAEPMIKTLLMQQLQVKVLMYDIDEHPGAGE